MEGKEEEEEIYIESEALSYIIMLDLIQTIHLIHKNLNSSLHPAAAESMLNSGNFAILSQNIRHRPQWRNSKWINLRMRLRIMLLDMLELRRFAKRRDVPVQMTQPLVDRRVSRANVAQVCFEVLHIHGVEADDSRVESDIGLGDAVAVHVLFTRKMGLDFVQCREKGDDGLFVCFLRSREAGLVDAVVDVVVDPVVGRLDLGAE